MKKSICEDAEKSYQTLKDDVKKMFIYVVSHLKGMEYDVNKQLDSLEKISIDQHKVSRIINLLKLPEVDVEKKKDRREFSLSESIMDFLGTDQSQIENSFV